MRRILILMTCVLFIVVVTGCDSLFTAIPKDTVMVKKIMQEKEDNEVVYEGVLSQDAVKTLSVQAVNHYFDQQLSIDDLQFEIMAVDQNKLKELLKEAESSAGPVSTERSAIQVQPQPKFQFQSDISSITGGLYYITLTKSTRPYAIYDIVLNAKDGDVLKVLRSKRESTGAAVRVQKKVFDIADEFVKAKGSYPLSELTQQINMTYWGASAELYYTSKDNKFVKYNVMVNNRYDEVDGFTKDIMALLSYYSRN
jgi:hypothetical protein